MNRVQEGKRKREEGVKLLADAMKYISEGNKPM